MEPNIQEAVAVLKKFIIAMNKWEVYYYNLTMDYVDKGEYEKLEPLDAKKREDLDAIFNTYCTLRERKYGRQAALGFPPDYSPDEEILATEVLKKNKIAIETQDHSILEYRYRYTLHYKNKEWRIDKKEVYKRRNDKWEKYPL